MKPYYSHAGITIYHEFDKSFDEVEFMYDPKCGELAAYFLADLEHQPEEVEWLAQDIQDQIERWFEGRHHKPKEVTP